MNKNFNASITIEKVGKIKWGLVIPALGRLRQDDFKFEGSRDNMAMLCLKKKLKKKRETLECLIEWCCFIPLTLEEERSKLYKHLSPESVHFLEIEPIKKHRIWLLFGFWVLRTCVSDQSYRVISMSLFQSLWKESPSVSSLSQSWALVTHLSKLCNLADNADCYRGAFHEITTLPTS
jgi:hypothetical protein